MPTLDKSQELPPSLRWDFYSSALIFLFVVIILFRWTYPPTFIDVYYHLSTMLGFNISEGFSPRAFWEYAPVGRAQLYPPLLHFIMLAFYKLGLPAIKVAKLMEFLMYPALLITLWLLIKKIFSRRLAFFAVLIAVSSYPFYLSTVDFLASSLAVIFGLLAFLSLERRRLLAAILLLTLAFYSHSSTSFYLVLSFILYGFFNRQGLKSVLTMIIGAVILASPLFIYQFNLRHYISFRPVAENFPLEINFLVCFLALIDLFFLLKKTKDIFFSWRSRF